MVLDTGFVTLLLGLLAVMALMALIGVILWMRRTARIRIAASAIAKIEITLSPEERESALTQLREAILARGETHAVVPKLPDRLRLGRILWVDGNPDTNLFETITLLRLGTSVVKATHADAALAYLSADRYTAVVFGIDADTDLEAVDAFVIRARTHQPGILTLGYAAPDVVTDAAEFTLLRTPGELVAAVIAPLTVA